MHSIYSNDGEYTPAELVKMCHQAGVGIMAISDHNCAKANDDAKKEAEHLNIRYIPAIELDCIYNDVDLHLLGYNINYKSPDFETIESNIQKQGRDMSIEHLRLTRQLGFNVTEDELNEISQKGYWKEIWTGEMFAEILLAKPEYLANEILRPYRKGGVRSDNPLVNFYWDYYSQGKPCYAKMSFPDLKDAISIVKDNGGKAVLAHPGNNLKNRFDLFEKIVKLGIDGVEAFCSYHDRSTAQYFCQEAQKHKLFVTCGSDFHGKTKPKVLLGESGCADFSACFPLGG
jgi:hypothetical protein